VFEKFTSNLRSASTMQRFFRRHPVFNAATLSNSPEKRRRTVKIVSGDASSRELRLRQNPAASETYSRHIPSLGCFTTIQAEWNDVGAVFVNCVQ